MRYDRLTKLPIKEQEKDFKKSFFTKKSKKKNLNHANQLQWGSSWDFLHKNLLCLHITNHDPIFPFHREWNPYPHVFGRRSNLPSGKSCNALSVVGTQSSWYRVPSLIAWFPAKLWLIRHHVPGLQAWQLSVVACTENTHLRTRAR